MGDFAVIHLSGIDVGKSLHAMSASQDPWDVAWRDLTRSLHGIDFAQGEAVRPRIEKLYGMDDGAAGPARPFLFIAPVGDPTALRELAAQLQGPRHDEYAAARRRLGVHREFVFLRRSASGDAVVFYWLADDPKAALTALMQSDAPVDSDLRDVAHATHPVPMKSWPAPMRSRPSRARVVNWSEWRWVNPVLVRAHELQRDASNSFNATARVPAARRRFQYTVGSGTHGCGDSRWFPPESPG